MLKILNVPTSNISTLKKSPTDLFKKAEKEKTGIYIFNRNTPEGVVMSVKDYENAVQRINNLQEELENLEIANRLKTNKKLYSDEEVRGDKADKNIELDENDGWE